MKKYIALLLAALLLCTVASAAYAERFTGPEDWKVTLTAGGKLETGSAELRASLTLEPGDEAVYSVRLENRHASAADFYVENAVLHSLEDRSSVASGGAYRYELIWLAPDGAERVLYQSNSVGGEIVSNAGEGLHEIGDQLQDYWYLTTLKSGQSGVLTLRVGLDGESIGNDYQLTQAELTLRFAAALKDGDEVDIVKTGDESRNAFPYHWLMLGSGALILLLLFVMRVLRRRERGQGE